jgi:glucokinase
VVTQTASSTCCIGVDVGGSHIAAAVASLDGQITWREHTVLDGDPDGKRSLARLVEALQRALAQIPTGDGAVVCVGVPGFTDFEHGFVTAAYAVGWPQLALKQILEERYRVPTLVENDVNLATLAEARVGAGQGLRNLVCLRIGTNIGGGVILNGQLYRGSHGAAGEIGLMVPEPALLSLSHVSDGCLESYAGGQGIALQARKALAARPHQRSALLDAAGGDPDAIRAVHVFAAARQGDEVATAVLNRVFDYLATTMANIICLLDPEMIVIGGGVARAGDMIIAAIRQRIGGLSVHQPALALSTLGEDAVLLGALALAQDYANDYNRRK